MANVDDPSTQVHVANATAYTVQATVYINKGLDRFEIPPGGYKVSRLPVHHPIVAVRINVSGNGFSCRAKKDSSGVPSFLVHEENGVVAVVRSAAGDIWAELADSDASGSYYGSEEDLSEGEQEDESASDGDADESEEESPEGEQEDENASDFYGNNESEEELSEGEHNGERIMEFLPLAKSVNQLSQAIWNLKQPLENAFLSPISIELALLLAANGCKGAALAEILSVLGLSSSQPALDTINGWVKDMMERLNSLSNPRKSFVRIANSIWISSDAFPQGFNQDFQRAVGENFSASANSVPGGSLVDQVNSWCAAETEGKIKEILKLPTVLCLVNAVYFKGIWASKFQKNLTSTMEFHESSGSVSPCYMMSLTEKLSYIENREYQAVCLPYRADGDIVLDAVVVLPKEGAPLEMSQGRWARLWQSLCETREVKGTLLMPRFKVESSFELKNDLMQAGIQGLFRGTHELGPMVAGGVQIDEIIHKVVIEVNEEGTEAAAVTGMALKGIAPPP